MKCSLAPLEQPWSNVVARYCVFVSRHPWPFIIIPTLLCLGLSSGVLMHFRIIRGVHYLYSPLNATWKTEEAVFGENWANSDQHYHPAKDFMRRRGVYMIITAKDSGSVLRKEHAKQFLEVLQYIGKHNLTSTTGRNYSYHDICLHFQNECFSNSHGRLIADIFARGDEDHFNITYPKWASRYATEKIDVMRLLGNVSFDVNGYVNGASAWMILYQLVKFDEKLGELSKEFENGIAAEIENGTLSAPLLNIYYFHSATFDQELAKEQDRIIPKFSITFCVLIVFSVLTTFTFKWVDLPGVKVKRRRFLVIDWVLSKPLLGIVGVISTLMAIISATGLMLLCGVTFVDMCTVMPFLSLTIGIDDTFLMLAAWHETNRLHTVEQRVESAMRHAAVSISITSLTDCIAFLIGASAPLPAVIYFCYYSSAAIFFIFLYCMTVFVATLSLQGRIEEKERNSMTLGETVNLKERFLEDVSLKKLLFKMGSHVRIAPDLTNNNDVNCEDAHNPKKDADNRMWYQKFFEDKFGPFISKPYMVTIFFGLYATYAFLAYYGISNLVIGFDLINVVQKSTSPRAFLTARNTFFPMDAKIVDIAVMKPPNMGIRHEREAFLSALEEFESSWCSEGRNSTDFWYFSFQEYMNGLGFNDEVWSAMLEDEETFTSNLEGFLMANDKYSYDVLRNENGTTIAFRLSTRITNVTTDFDMYECAEAIRELCRKFGNFQMTTYTPLWNIADEYEIMWPQTMQDLYFSIIAMIPVALLFIPQPLCVIVIGVNIFSIAFGVLGFMTFLGISLDAISMITIAMSVGFSVDFAAHVSYAYMTEKREPRKNENIAHAKLRYTLGTVAWPVTQASISVLLGISSLSMVDSYVVQTCFKTIILVIFFGTAHALVFLPLSLYGVHRFYLFVRGK